MDVFSQEAKQQVLETLFAIATENKSASLPAIKLYLDLAAEQSTPDLLTVEQALEILREAMPQNESPSVSELPPLEERQASEI